MTSYPIKINGTDVSWLFHKRGYETFRTPVYAATYQDLEQTDHYVVSRWKGGLVATTNDLTAQEAAELSALLLAAPVEVEYYSFDLGKTVVETMMPETVPLALKLRTSRASWLQGVTITFNEL